MIIGYRPTTANLSQPKICPKIQSDTFSNSKKLIQNIIYKQNKEEGFGPLFRKPNSSDESESIFQKLKEHKKEDNLPIYNETTKSRFIQEEVSQVSQIQNLQKVHSSSQMLMKPLNFQKSHNFFLQKQEKDLKLFEEKLSEDKIKAASPKFTETIRSNNLEIKYFEDPIKINEKNIINLQEFNFNHFSKSLKGYNPVRLSKVNQDRYFIFATHKLWIAGICDGHGPNGHLVSEFIKISFPKIFMSNWRSYLCKSKTHFNLNSFKNFKKLSLQDGKENTEVDFVELQAEQRNNIIRNTILEIDRELERKNIDISSSRSTCIVVFVGKNKIICSNVGDSRAILGSTNCSLNNKTFWNAIKLSVDQKPNQPEEAKRINNSKGRIESLKGHFEKIKMEIPLALLVYG